MTNYFIFTVLFIYGVHAITREGMLLAWIRTLIIRLVIKVTKNEVLIGKILKPICDCTPCMASVYGTISYLLLFPYTLDLYLVIWVFSLSGFNYILNKIISNKT